MPDLTPEDISKLNLVPSSISLWICDQARKAADEYLSYRWKLIAGGAALVLMFFTYAGYSLDKAARDLQERAGKVQQLADDSVKEANKRKQDIDSILKSVELYKTQIEYLQKRVNDQTDDSGRQLREVRDEHSKVNAVVSSVQASAFQVKNAEASIGASKTDIDKKHGIVLTKSSQVDVAANTVEVKSKETKDLFDKLQQKTETLSKLETELAHSYDELFGLKQQELIFMLSTDQRDISLSFFPKVKIENGKVQVPPAKKVKVTIRTHGINPLTVEIDVIERPDGSRGVKEFFSKLAYNRETPSDHIIQGTPFKFRVDFIYHDRLAHDWVVLRFLVDTEKIPFYSALQNPTPKTENESMVAAEWRPESMGAGQKFERYFGKSFTNRNSFLAPTVLAAFDQARNNPREWGQGANGYFMRFGARFARRTVDKTFEFIVGAAHGEDPRSCRSGVTGVWPRVRWSLASTVVARKDDGGHTLALSRIAGSYGTAALRQAWEPGGSGFGTVVRRGSASLLLKAGGRVLKEFWPDIRSRFSHTSATTELCEN